jgi:hypothetical protein
MKRLRVVLAVLLGWISVIMVGCSFAFLKEDPPIFLLGLAFSVVIGLGALSLSKLLTEIERLEIQLEVTEKNLKDKAGEILSRAH